MPSFRLTYGELQDKGMYSVLEEIKAFYNKNHSGNMFAGFVDGVATYEHTNYVAKEPNAKEILELIEYIRRWEVDVEEHFKFRNFIKYEWYYPLKNKCYDKIKAKRR
jgi:hemerythrin superfamily protein